MPERNVDRLLQNGYMQRRTLYPRKGGKPHEALSLTAKGRAALEAYREPGDKQQYWTEAVKPREMEHDMAIYPACKKEVEKIESAGGKVKQVRMDFEFKRSINRKMNRPGKSGSRPTDQEKSERRSELAAENELPVHDGSVMIPDARIEYEDADGIDKHVDVEVVTDKYRGSMRASKEASGFRLHYTGSAHGRSDSGGRAAPRDDHHLEFLQ